MFRIEAWAVILTMEITERAYGRCLPHQKRSDREISHAVKVSHIYPNLCVNSTRTQSTVYLKAAAEMCSHS
jgi:hypothetical protein